MTDIEELGAGGFGKVRKVRHPKDESVYVAAKEIILDEFTAEEERRKEIRVLQKLSKHPNVVAVIDYVLNGTWLMIYMELCDASLADYIFGPKTSVMSLPKLPSVVDMFRQISEALHFCHSKGIVHKDVKPHNILIKLIHSENTVLKLADFGLSKVLSPRNGNRFPAYDSVLNNEHSLNFLATGAGSLGYCSPELHHTYYGKDNMATSKVDVFAAGIVFYQIICGPFHPFGNDKDSVEAGIEAGQYCLDQGLTKGTEAYHLIERMISFSPSERPSMQAVCDHPLLMSNSEKLLFLDCQIYGVQWSNRYERSFHNAEPFAWERLKGVTHWKDIPAYSMMHLHQEDWFSTFFDENIIQGIQLDEFVKKEKLEKTAAAHLTRIVSKVFDSATSTYSREKSQPEWDDDQFVCHWLERGRFQQPSLLLLVWLETYATCEDDKQFNFYPKWTELQRNVEVDASFALEDLAEGTDINGASDVDGKTPLHVAVSKASVETVEKLCRKGASSWDVPDHKGWTPIHYASRRSKEFLQLCFSQIGAQLPKSLQNDGWTPLHIAASLGFKDNVELLLSHGAAVNAVDDQTNTPLHCANTKSEGSDDDDDYTSTAKLLIQYGADINARNSSNETPLMLAALYDRAGIAKLLLEHPYQKVDVNAKGGERDQRPALFYAAQSNSIQIARMLIEHGADVEAKDSDDDTALATAASYDSVEVAKILLDNQANVNHGFPFSATPILYATSVEMASLLVQYGAKVNAVARTGRGGGDGPLFQAARDNAVDLVKFLIANGAFVNLRNDKDETALFYAADSGAAEAALVLLEHGALVNVQNNCLDTPLYVTVNGRFRRSASVAKLLLERGADVNIRKPQLLFAAARCYQFEIAEMLLERGLEVNARDYANNTPLLEAIDLDGYLKTEETSRRLETIKMLLDRGARVNVENDRGETPLTLAERNEEVEVMKLLEQYRSREDVTK